MASAKKLTIATPDDLAGLTLMHVHIEGIKRIRLVDISITDALTTVGGDHAQGKTSFIDAYQYCMGGKTAMQMDPIAHGRQQGTMLYDFGDGEKIKFSVKRTVKRVGDADFTTDVQLNIPGFVPPSRVEEFLRDLTGKMSFDPMMLDRMNDGERYEALKKLVVGFDFEENTKTRTAAEARRRDINRDQKRSQAAAEAIQIDEKAPAERIDEGALVGDLEQAGQFNTDLEARRANRETLKLGIADRRKAASSNTEQIAGVRSAKLQAHQRYVAGQEERIANLRQQIRDVETAIADQGARVEEEIVAEESRLRENAASLEREAAQFEQRLAEAGELPDAKDAPAIRGKLLAAQQSNRLLADWEGQRARKVAHQRESDELQNQSDELTAAIVELDQERTRAIEGAQLPVDGLGFGDGIIMLGGVPWVQASTKERVDASTSLAMAMNPKLKVILIRNGSDLLPKARDRIRERAAERGYRVLMEVVDDSGSTSITLENGEVKAHAEAVA